MPVVGRAGTEAPGDSGRREAAIKVLVGRDVDLIVVIDELIPANSPVAGDRQASQANRQDKARIESRRKRGQACRGGRFFLQWLQTYRHLPKAGARCAKRTDRTRNRTRNGIPSNIERHESVSKRPGRRNRPITAFPRPYSAGDAVRESSRRGVAAPVVPRRQTGSSYP